MAKHILHLHLFLSQQSIIDNKSLDKAAIKDNSVLVLLTLESLCA